MLLVGSDEIAQFLRQKRKEKDLSVLEVIERLSRAGLAVADKTLYGWESGIRRPDVSSFLLLCSLYDVREFSQLTGDTPPEEVLSREELARLRKFRLLDLHGKEMVDAVLNGEYNRMTRHEDADQEQKHNITYINCYDLAVSAGTGQPVGDTHYKTKLEIPTKRVPAAAHFCLRVSGDSMEPAYRDGDIVFVERIEGSVSQGEIGIFYLNGEAYIKKLGHAQLLSLNPDYPPIPLGEFDSIQCQGRVLGKL